MRKKGITLSLYLLSGLTLCGCLLFNIHAAKAEGVTVYNSYYECALQAVHLQDSLEELTCLADRAKGRINKIYLHWSAMPYDRAYDAYHINIGRFGELRITCAELTEKKAHTWRRNGGAVGISMDCMYNGAYRENQVQWGACPPTKAQILALAKVVAVLTDHLGLNINEDTVMTHAEAAAIDGYGVDSGEKDTRWDLLYLLEPDSHQEMLGGALIRELARK